MDTPQSAGSLWEMFGIERFLENCLLEPEVIEAVIENVTQYCLEYYERLIEAGKPFIGKNFNAIHLADDLAIQNSIIMGEQHIRRFFTKAVQKADRSCTQPWTAC